MSTFLSDAKIFYHDFFENDAWNDELADKRLQGLKDKNKRKKCIKDTYDLILNDPLIEESTKLWVQKSYSLQDTAIFCKISIDKLRNNNYYLNKTLGKDLTYEKESILRYCLNQENITSNDWKAINQILMTTITKRKTKAEKVNRILNNRSLMINIPRKEYNTSIEEEQFNSFLRLIQPYFINERKRTQQEINNNFLDAAGYLNYILTPGIELSDRDKKRLEKVKKLLDAQTLKNYKKLSKDKIASILSTEEEPEPQKESTEPIEDGISSSVEYKTTRIQF